MQLEQQHEQQQQQQHQEQIWLKLNDSSPLAPSVEVIPIYI